MNIWNDDIYTFVLKETLIVVHIRQSKDDARWIRWRVHWVWYIDRYFIDKLCNFALFISHTPQSPPPTINIVVCCNLIQNTEVRLMHQWMFSEYDIMILWCEQITGVSRHELRTQHLWGGYHPTPCIITPCYLRLTSRPALRLHHSASISPWSQFSYQSTSQCGQWTSILMGTSPFSVFDLKKYIVEIELGLWRKADKRASMNWNIDSMYIRTMN